jgi:energy-coupling factor transporter ATP-binding protein EcfA2
LTNTEKQKISLARILILKKDFLLIDEATSAIDHQSSIDIEKYLLSNSDLTLLYVTHKIHEETKDMFDNVIEMKAQ